MRGATLARWAVLALILAIVFVPMYWIVATSFKTGRQILLSESVYVPPQAEEVVPPLTPTLLPRVLVAGAILVGLVLLYWVMALVVAALHPSPAYAWLSARKGGQVLFPHKPPAGWVAPSCEGFSLDDPAAKRDFITLPDKNQLQLNVGFEVQFLPPTLPLSATYTIRLTDQAVSPCVESVPDPADPGEAVKLNYVTRRQTDPESSDIGALTVFEGFPYSKKKDYVDWVTEAKTEETRKRRLATSVEWLAEGKSRNWKYERC